MIERWAPLRPVERQFYAESLAYHARVALALDLPPSAQDWWALQRDPAGPGYMLNHPDFHHCEGQVIVVGRVPTDKV